MRTRKRPRASCRCKLSLAALVIVLVASSALGQSQTDSGGTTGPSNPDSVNDVITTSFSSNSAKADSDAQTALKNIQSLQEVPWGSGSSPKGLEQLVNNQLSQEPIYSEECNLVDKNQIYIFHITNWEAGADGKLAMISSDWYAYKFSGKENLKFSGFSGTGDQLLYGKTKALIIGISEIAGGHGDISVLTEQYQTTVTQGTPENAQDLGQVAAALAGISTPKSLTKPKTPPPIPILISVGCQAGNAKLPFTVTVTVTDTLKTATNHSAKGKNNESAPPTPSAGSATCSTNGNQPPCAAQHAFVSEDREWWDISIGITLPGTRETQYSFSNGAVQSSVTRHTDLYGMFDFFPAWKWLPKDSYFPHIVVGLPVTSQSLYRPYFGLSENLTGWTHLEKKLGLPVAVSFFAGEVYMKTNSLIDNPATQAAFNTDLKPTHVWKTVFGIEVPISSIASKIGGKKGG